MENPPTDKVELMAQMEAGRARWEDVLGRVDALSQEVPNVEGSWSLKQIVAHILGYELWLLALLTDLQDPASGSEATFDAFWQEQLNGYRQDHPDFPADLHELTDDETNAVVVTYYDQFSAAEILEHERNVYQQLARAARKLADARYLEPWEPGRGRLIDIFPNQCYEHYDMHLPAIKKWLIGLRRSM